MSELPTAPIPSPSAAVMRALTDIEAAKSEADPAVAHFLDHVGELIVQHGDPDAVFGRVIDALAREDIKTLATAHGLTLHTTRAVEQPPETYVIWKAIGGLAIVPQGLPPRVVLEQLRAAVAEMEEGQRLTRSFQASVAAGHVEDVDTWFARIDKAAR